MLDFLGIGGQKCGTTWVFKRLAMHPETYFPMGKEAHYWNKNTNNPRSKYLNAFLRSHFAGRNGWKCGEITPVYLTMPRAKIEKLHSVFPDAKVFVIVRDPVSRTWSHIRQRARGEKRQRLRGELSPERVVDLANRRPIYIKSAYAQTMQAWREFYDIKVLLYEDISANPIGILTELCAFVGIDTGFFPKLPLEVIEAPVHAYAPEEFPPGLVESVLGRHEADIAAVEAATGRNLPHWRMIERAPAD